MTSNRCGTLSGGTLSARELNNRYLQGDRIDLDSMDWLNFLLGLHDKLKVEIPEADYAKLVTLDEVVAYLAAKSP